MLIYYYYSLSIVNPISGLLSCCLVFLQSNYKEFKIWFFSPQRLKLILKQAALIAQLFVLINLQLVFCFSLFLLLSQKCCRSSNYRRIKFVCSLCICVSYWINKNELKLCWREVDWICSFLQQIIHSNENYKNRAKSTIIKM
jgi:hypothetical protein